MLRLYVKGFEQDRQSVYPYWRGNSNAYAPTPDISPGINHHGYCSENSCSRVFPKYISQCR